LAIAVWAATFNTEGTMLFSVRVCAPIFLSLLLTTFAFAGDAPATQPTSSIHGTVIAESEVPLSEMVIYLESPDANRKFALPEKPVQISQKGAKFAPPMTVICVNQSVDFLNDEDRPIEHNVFSNAPAKRFDLGLYRPGESRSVKFDKPGPVFLYCSIHRYMDGVIYVAPTPFTSRVSADGKYQIDNVPPGTWMVKTWQRRRRFAEQSISVMLEASKPQTIDMELKHK
jgi:plastocyanin